MEPGSSNAALEGVLVLDLSSNVAGPYCTRLLAGLGAEVIKIEDPETGDEARKLMPLTSCGPQLECGAIFHHLNGGKKSVTLNLKAEKGHRLFEHLATDAQIVIESFRPAFRDSLGIGYRSLVEHNPSLVMTSISAFGQDGPYRDYVADDLVCQAMGGLVFTCGDPAREPLKLTGAQAEYLGGLNAAIVTLAAHWCAEISGLGQWVDVSIMESVVSALEATTIGYSLDGVVRRRQGQAYPCALLQCQDGYIGFMLPTDDQWEIFARLSGLERLLDAKFATPEGRSHCAEEIEAIMRPFLMERTRSDLVHWAQELRLPFSMVLAPEELLSDPQHQARDFFVTVDHPIAGDVLQLGGPFRMSETRWRSGRAPLLGEHTKEVLREKLNLGEDELWVLKREGVI